VALRGAGEVRKQLDWALGMWRKHKHAYDAGYADALAWALGEESPTRGAEAETAGRDREATR